MTKIYDEQTDFEQGGDSGQNTAASIQPIAEAEPLWQDPLNRSPENLRKRTEVLRRAIDDLRYYADYDRSLLLRSNAQFQFIEADPLGDPGRYKLTMTGGDLWVYPALTPGRNSGGRDLGAKLFTDQGGNWTPYAGTAGLNDLILVASSTYTGMRGFADSDTLASPTTGVSVGGNRLRVSLVANPAIAGGVATMTIQVTGNPAVNVIITYGTLTPTTLNDVIAKINGDLNSQGSYGLAHMMRASTTSPGVSAPPALTNGIFQGGYDAEAHRITAAMLDPFFNAQDGGGNYINRLREGEGLALSFEPGPVEYGPIGTKGGRRQAIWDLPTDRVGGNTTNTSPGVGWNLFNTGREPEKIPGSVPIGKMIEGVFIFIDGTLVSTDLISLGESGTSLARFAATGPTAGAELIGYGGSGAWDADSAGAPTGSAVPVGTVEAALDKIVQQLSLEAAGDSGARRLGAEAQTGNATLGNLPLSLLPGSIRTQILELLNAGTSPSSGGGVNRRVSENGHRLKGSNPVEKRFTEAAPLGGGHRFRAITNTPANLFSDGQKNDFADVLLQPMAYTVGPVTHNAAEAIDRVGAAFPDEVHFTSVSGAHLTQLVAVLTVARGIADEYGNPLNIVIASIQGATGGTDNDGYYYVLQVSDPSAIIILQRLDGTSPDFSTTNFAAATITFYNTVVSGNDGEGRRVKGFHYSPSPFATFGMASQNQVFLRLYDAFNYLQTSLPSMELSGEKARFKIGQVAGIHSHEKSTSNILIPDDYALLRGIEAGGAGAPIPVDASLNHHHSSDYDRIVFWSTPKTVTVVGGGDLATMATGNQTINSDTSELPAGYKKKAVILKVQVLINNTGAGSGTPVSATFRYRVAGAPSNVGNTETRAAFYKTDPASQTLVFSDQIMVQVTTSAPYQYTLEFIGGANLSAGACTILVYELGAVLTNI